MSFKSEIIMLIVFFLPVSTFAQSPADTQDQTSEPEGVKSGGYIVHQSIDLGVRDSEVTGSRGMYGTLVESAHRPAHSRTDILHAIRRSAWIPVR